MPLSAYYDVGALQRALAPRQLMGVDDFFGSASRSESSRAVLLLVYEDFSPACRRALTERPASAAACPLACLPRTQRFLVHTALENATRGWRRICASAAEVALGMREGRALPSLARYRFLVLLNFRRHDGRRPLMPTVAAHRLRATAVRPSQQVKQAAHRFLHSHGLLAQRHTVVQLRSNHLAHSAYVRGGSANCSRRVASCVRRLSRAAKREAAASETIVASDLPTLFWENQVVR
eukprot:CAMPEP_0181170836 /NCGR_PEP_ID=MMETSP1096-20121128/1580_1 /TAXON_ID=156174 ORGANISM="Chrysochromulina ericina, Strain CCMP281" /NCGR_SAMPLE_ID=MMETSP1096 /ASSEMBLY_ACC=CAM_ASM_000453 /LENGTH=235 /DNA_ID=CAMNT_0023258427 /DNA_START=53 /DNA_END=760 /DNA_ORIENTATION=-